MSEENAPDLEAAYNLETPEDNRRLYKDWASTYDEDYAQRTGYRSAKLIAKEFIDAGGRWPVLDAGCGTGLVADHFPSEAIIDGVDISPEMVGEAAAKGRYRKLVEADLTKKLPIEDASYAGLTSAGTFTHGHVGPDAIRELLRVLKSGSICAISGNTKFLEKAGFQEEFDALVEQGEISLPAITEELIYEEDGSPPEGHENDTGLVIVFRRL